MNLLPVIPKWTSKCVLTLLRPFGGLLLPEQAAACAVVDVIVGPRAVRGLSRRKPSKADEEPNDDGRQAKDEDGTGDADDVENVVLPL